MHPQHKIILAQIKERSGKSTKHTASDAYVGTTHPRYPINVPSMRAIAKAWLRSGEDRGLTEFTATLTSLIRGKSCTEKLLAGLILNGAKSTYQSFDPNIFIKWLDHLIGWAEIDTLCTGNYAAVEIPRQWTAWKKILTALSRSPNINKRRASLVLFCTPIRKAYDPRLMKEAFRIMDRLKGEKEVIITKAISWVLRCGIGFHAAEVKKYVDLNEETLPKIAVRETRTKLTTGRKTKRKQ